MSLNYIIRGVGIFLLDNSKKKIHHNNKCSSCLNSSCLKDYSSFCNCLRIRRYKPTGRITTDLVKDMNIPALARVQQLLINMQRMPTKPEGELIIVNISGN